MFTGQRQRSCGLGKNLPPQPLNTKNEAVMSLEPEAYLNLTGSCRVPIDSLLALGLLKLTYKNVGLEGSKLCLIEPVSSSGRTGSFKGTGGCSSCYAKHISWVLGFRL